MTDAEKEAIPKALVVNAPGVDGPINVELIKTLWTNTSPTTAFARQVVTFTSDNYDFLLIVYAASTANASFKKSVICRKDDPTDLEIYYKAAESANDIMASRQVLLVQDTDSQLWIQNARIADNSEDNTKCIPIAIYGIKSSVTVDVSAVISDVSTSADKCMMSDGVTSVEDAIEEVDSNKLNKTGGTLSGNLTIGTTSRGELKLVGYDPTYKGRFYNSSVDTLTADRSYAIPNKDGTLALLSDIFISCPRKNTIDLNNLPELNKVNFVEASPESSNLPNASGWYHIMTIQGADSQYATQIAIGLTVGGIYYRRETANVWGTWHQIQLI